MNKKLIAVAVAGVFAAPAAFAQSSVTISGQIKGGFEQLKLSGAAAGVNRGNTSQTGVVDDSSALVFSVTEDLGGGLSAVVRLDMRIKPDDGGGSASIAGAATGAYNPGNLISGNSHMGLLSKQWGRIVFGRQDLHYFNTESNITDKASLRASTTSLLSYIGGASIANATRTTNVVHYLSPNWSGFTFILAYSSNPFNTEADIGGATVATANSVRKGSAWNFNPNFAAANWQIGYSYWDSKPDNLGPLQGQVNAAIPGTAAAAGPVNQRGDRLYGSYVFPFGLKIGLAYDNTKFKSVATGAQTAKRDAWSLPVSYNWGNHTVHVNYTKAGDEKVAAGQQGADMWALAYSYDLSKRTSLALTYAQIKNKNPDGLGVGGGTYNLFTSTSLGLGGSAGALTPGEDPKMFGVTMRHAF
jgi:predicted porin